MRTPVASALRATSQAQLSGGTPTPAPNQSRVYLPLVLKAEQPMIVVYAGPGNVDFDRVAELPAGTDFTLLGRYGDFVKVRWIDEDESPQEGFVWVDQLGHPVDSLPTMSAEEVPWMRRVLVDPAHSFTLDGEVYPFGALEGASIEADGATVVHLDFQVPAAGMERAGRGQVSGVQILNSVRQHQEGSHFMAILRAQTDEDAEWEWAFQYREAIPEEGRYQTRIWEPLPIRGDGAKVDVEIGGNKITIANADGDRRVFPLPNSFDNVGAALLQMARGASVTVNEAYIEVAPSGEWEETRALKSLFGQGGVVFGATNTAYQAAVTEPPYYELTLEEFNATKASVSRSVIEEFGLNLAEGRANFARANNMEYTIGHLFYQTANQEAPTGTTREQKEAYMRRRADLLRHFPDVDRVTVWVEPLWYNPETGENGFVPGPLVEEFGPVGALTRAFAYAHAANPNARLYLSEGYAWGENPQELLPKADAINELLKDLIVRGAPIHGVDIQLQNMNAANPLTKQEIDDSIDTILSGIDQPLDIVFGELLVTTSQLPEDWSEERKEERQAEIYKYVIEIALEREEVKRVDLWKAFDWVNREFPEDLSEVSCCLIPEENPGIFGEDWRPKPAYWAVHDAVRDAISQP